MQKLCSRCVSLMAVTVYFLGLASCSGASQIAHIDGKECWPKVAVGQEISGTAVIFSNSELDAAYGANCDRVGAIFEWKGVQRLLEPEYEALNNELKKAPNDYVSMRFPAYVEGKIVSMARGRVPVLRPISIRRQGPIKFMHIRTD